MKLRTRRSIARPKLTFEVLEDRKLLATIDILAAGTSGLEQINLIVSDQVVATFDDLGTGAYSNRFNTLTYSSATPFTAGDVRIEFVNNAHDPVDRDVQIDAIIVDGQRFEAEASDVFSTGTWRRSDGVVPGFRESEFLQVNGYFQFADPIVVAANSPDVFHRSFDPNVGTILTAFTNRDPEDPRDPFDILTGWKAAIDELESLGVSEVTFAVFRNVQDGRFSGGPTLATITSAVEYANERGFSVTMLPLFEANGGWRGEYDPTGEERTRFRSGYRQLISDLAQIEGIARFSVASELNRLIDNTDNHTWIKSLISDVRSTFEAIGNTTGRVGITANFDAYDNPQHTALLTQSDIDYVGISAYYSVIDRADADLVAGVGEVSDRAFETLVNNWTGQLDRLSNFGSENGLPVVIQEFGAVQRNYAAVAPFSVSPGDWVDDGSPDQFAVDANEQAALYESLITALDGRAEDFESVVFWTWEHTASRGERSYEGAPADEPRFIETFAIWPTDGGAGEYLAKFLSTAVDGPQSTVGVAVDGSDASDEIEGTDLDDVLSGLSGDDVINGLDGNDVINGGTGSDRIDAGAGADQVFGGSYRDVIFGGQGNDRIDAGSGFDEVFGGEGDDIIAGHWGNDFLDGGQGADQIDGGIGNDTIHGGTESDSITGGVGNDTIFAGTHADVVEGNAGDDTVFASSGWDVVFGNEGNDQLFGEWGNDTLFGGTGDDLIDGGVGNDTIDGGEGIDTAIYSGNSEDYTVVEIADGIYEISGVAIDGVDTVQNVERLQFKDGTFTLSTVSSPSQAAQRGLRTAWAVDTSAEDDEKSQLSQPSNAYRQIAVGGSIQG